MENVEKLHDVEYKIGDLTVTAKLPQKDLGRLLLKDGVILLSVNKPKSTYVPRSRARKRK